MVKVKLKKLIKKAEHVLQKVSKIGSTITKLQTMLKDFTSRFILRCEAKSEMTFLC